MLRLAILMLLTALFSVLLGGIPSVQAETAGVRITLDGSTLPAEGQILDGRTLVPFRPIFEALGAEVHWDPDARMVTAARGRDSLALTIGSPVVEWRRSRIKVDAPPVIIDGRTLVPRSMPRAAWSAMPFTAPAAISARA